MPAYLKAGARWREQTRTNVGTPYSGTYVGPDGVMGVNPTTRLNDDNLAQFMSQRPLSGDLARYPRFPFPNVVGEAPSFGFPQHDGFRLATLSGSGLELAFVQQHFRAALSVGYHGEFRPLIEDIDKGFAHAKPTRLRWHARLERPCMRSLRYAEECFAHRVNELDA